jgi:hypothetical protein
MNLSAGNNINVEAGKFAAGNDVNMTAANDLNLLQGETRGACPNTSPGCAPG